MGKAVKRMFSDLERMEILERANRFLKEHPRRKSL